MTEKAKERGEQNVYPLKIDGKNDSVMIHFGMNLREYYAGLAMQGFCSNSDLYTKQAKTMYELKEIYSSLSLQFADALLEELSKDE